MAPSGMVLGSRGARACDMCARDRARWYCAADEAYLCERCDGAVHLANAVARRHERVRLGPNGAPLKLDRRSASRSSLYRAGDWTFQNKYGSKKKRPNQPQYMPPLPGVPGLVNPNHDPHISTTPNVKIEAPEAALHATSQEPLKEQSCAAAAAPPAFIIKDEPCSPITESQLTFYRELLDLKSDDENDPNHDEPAIEPLLRELIAASHGELLHHDVVSTLPSIGESSSHESTVSDIKVIKTEESNLALHDSELLDCTAVDEGSFSMDDTCSDIDTFDVVDLCANTGVEQDILGSYDLVCDVLSDSNTCDQKISEEQAAHGVDLVTVPDVNGSQYTNNESTFTLGYGARLEKSLSLRLNYEEIISAWSDKDSFWMDGQRPQIVPDCFLDAVPSADSSGLANPEYSSCSSSQAGHVPALSDAAREARVMRYKEKRRTRLFSKKIRYEVRKLNAERRPRMKGRFVKRSAIADMSN